MAHGSDPAGNLPEGPAPLLPLDAFTVAPDQGQALAAASAAVQPDEVVPPPAKRQKQAKKRKSKKRRRTSDPPDAPGSAASPGAAAAPPAAAAASAAAAAAAPSDRPLKQKSPDLWSPSWTDAAAEGNLCGHQVMLFSDGRHTFSRCSCGEWPRVPKDGSTSNIKVWVDETGRRIAAASGRAPSKFRSHFGCATKWPTQCVGCGQTIASARATGGHEKACRARRAAVAEVGAAPPAAEPGREEHGHPGMRPKQNSTFEGRHNTKGKKKTEQFRQGAHKKAIVEARVGDKVVDPIQCPSHSTDGVECKTSDYHAYQTRDGTCVSGVYSVRHAEHYCRAHDIYFNVFSDDVKFPPGTEIKSFDLRGEELPGMRFLRVSGSSMDAAIAAMRVRNLIPLDEDDAERIEDEDEAGVEAGPGAPSAEDLKAAAELFAGNTDEAQRELDELDEQALADASPELEPPEADSGEVEGAQPKKKKRKKKPQKKTHRPHQRGMLVTQQLLDVALTKLSNQSNFSQVCREIGYEARKQSLVKRKAVLRKERDSWSQAYEFEVARPEDADKFAHTLVKLFKANAAELREAPGESECEAVRRDAQVAVSPAADENERLAALRRATDWLSTRKEHVAVWEALVGAGMQPGDDGGPAAEPSRMEKQVDGRLKNPLPAIVLRGAVLAWAAEPEEWSRRAAQDRYSHAQVKRVATIALDHTYKAVKHLSVRRNHVPFAAEVFDKWRFELSAGGQFQVRVCRVRVDQLDTERAVPVAKGSDEARVRDFERLVTSKLTGLHLVVTVGGLRAKIVAEPADFGGDTVLTCLLPPCDPTSADEALLPAVRNSYLRRLSDISVAWAVPMPEGAPPKIMVHGRAAVGLYLEMNDADRSSLKATSSLGNLRPLRAHPTTCRKEASQPEPGATKHDTTCLGVDCCLATTMIYDLGVLSGDEPVAVVADATARAKAKAKVRDALHGLVVGHDIVRSEKHSDKAPGFDRAVRMALEKCGDLLGLPVSAAAWAAAWASTTKTPRLVGTTDNFVSDREFMRQRVAEALLQAAVEAAQERQDARHLLALVDETIRDAQQPRRDRSGRVTRRPRSSDVVVSLGFMAREGVWDEESAAPLGLDVVLRVREARKWMLELIVAWFVRTDSFVVLEDMWHVKERVHSVGMEAGAKKAWGAVMGRLTAKAKEPYKSADEFKAALVQFREAHGSRLKDKAKASLGQMLATRTVGKGAQKKVVDSDVAIEWREMMVKHAPYQDRGFVTGTTRLEGYHKFLNSVLSVSRRSKLALTLLRALIVLATIRFNAQFKRKRSAPSVTPCLFVPRDRAATVLRLADTNDDTLGNLARLGFFGADFDFGGSDDWSTEQKETLALFLLNDVLEVARRTGGVYRKHAAGDSAHVPCCGPAPDCGGARKNQERPYSGIFGADARPSHHIKRRVNKEEQQVAFALQQFHSGVWLTDHLLSRVAAVTGREDKRSIVCDLRSVACDLLVQQQKKKSTVKKNGRV